jgi:RimJ/RimL family protein N-acetyltransferase
LEKEGINIMKKILLKNKQELIIRKARKDDAENAIDFLNHVGSESDYLTLDGDKLSITVETEEKIIEDMNSKDNSIMIIGMIDKEIVSMVTFRGGERARIRHIGELGISVRKPYWGLGIGKLMLDFLINWAKETKVIRKINLRVRSDNEKAIKLYEKYGFEREGILKRDFCIDGEFYDSIHMGLLID